MTSYNLLEVEHVAANGIFCPDAIFHVCERVVDSCKHGDGDGVDRVDGDQVCLAVLANVEEGVEVWGPHLETILFDVLSVMEESPD